MVWLGVPYDLLPEMFVFLLETKDWKVIKTLVPRVCVVGSWQHVLMFFCQKATVYLVEKKRGGRVVNDKIRNV